VEVSPLGLTFREIGVTVGLIEFGIYLMKTNWDITGHNRNIEIGNYYGYWKMAKITLWGGPYTGTLGHWFVPIQHRDTFAQKVLAKFLAEIPCCAVYVCFPLPEVEDVGEPLFEAYKFEGKSAASVE
jgi:hypothetical protein